MANGLNGKQNLRSQKGTFDNLVTLYSTIAEKINSRSFNVHRDYSKSPTLSNAGGSF